MSPNSKMGQELKFQQRWEFRRRDNDFESSSDDSKSNSSGEPVFKKHKLVSSLISPKNDETSDASRFEQKGEDDAGTGGRVKFGKAKKKKIESNKKDNLVNNDMERDSFKKVNRKKSKSSAYDPASLNDLKIFMESLFEELKVTRENLLMWMREEMHKLMADDTTPQPMRREGSNGNEVVQVQHQSNFDSGMKLMADKTTRQQTRREDSYGQEIVQVQHQNIQNNLDSSLKLMADDSTQQPTRREDSYRQEIVPVQHQNDYESGVKLMADETMQQPKRREGSCGQEIAHLQHQENFESGMKTQKCNGGSIERSVKGQRTADSNNHYQVFEDGVKYGQGIEPLTSTEKNRGDRFGLSVKPKFSCNPLQHQNNFEAGMKFTADDTTQRPVRREGSRGQEIAQLQQQNNFESGMKPKTCNGGSIVRSVKSQRTSDSNNHYQVFEDRVEHGQGIGPLTTTEKDRGDRFGLSVKPKFSSTPSQHQKNFEAGVKLTADDTTQWPTRREGSRGQAIAQLQQQNNFDSGMKTKTCNGGSIERSVKSQRTAVSNNHYQVFEDRVEHGQGIGPLTSTEKDRGERFGLSVKPNFSSNSSDQVASSMYLTLPTVLPERRVEDQRIDSSSCNYIQPGISGNTMGGNMEIANLMLQASTQHGYFSGMQQGQQHRSIAPVGSRSSRNMPYFDQNCAPTSGIGAGFPVPLHQVLDGGLSIPSQVSMETLPRENNMLGLSMNGGAVRFSGGSRALSERYVANNFRSHLNYKADGRHMAFQTPDLKEGHLFPN